MKSEHICTKIQLKEISKSLVEEIKVYNLSIWQAKEVFRFAIDEIEKQILK